MWLHLCDGYNMKRLIESRVIRRKIMKTGSVTYGGTEKGHHIYNFNREDLGWLYDEILEVFREHKEMCMFKGKYTRTYKELEFILNTIDILEKDIYIGDKEKVMVFIVKEEIELYDLI